MTVEPDSALFRRFPLVARPRPIAGPLAARIDDLCALAERAAREDDRAAASAVYNQAALLASDCGQPDLARRWCHEHAAAYLRAVPLDARAARHALEPLVNLARLHIRDRNGDAALRLLTSLFEVVSSRTDAVIDGQALPASRLTRGEDDHREVRQWLWSVLVAEGARALAGAGRWGEAYEHLERHRGIGQRMLDGRQVAIIARLAAGDTASARSMVAETAPGEPWEDAVTACLAYLCDRSSHERLKRALQRLRGLQPARPLVMFQTRLSMTLLHAAAGAVDALLPGVASSMAAHCVTCGDAYAAREFLYHRSPVVVIGRHQTAQLADIVASSGLDLDGLPALVQQRLWKSLALCHRVLESGRPPWGEGLTGT
ncbi:hypothetical protein ACWIGG_21915 [Micromonospora aurantiaca (nom. illeg.)]|uniref:hypothetical protein n=1 Tax=Micromonospora sp. WMMA1949 TaxID=3015162 RepID=UPI0022B74DBA|nr:hypothetical protein [Micromonospora sp. WMMA1949]MCZ7424242.1 hypothetical protein [Micromonospora sp. WMMA1949]